MGRSFVLIRIPCLFLPLLSLVCSSALFLGIPNTVFSFLMHDLNYFPLLSQIFISPSIHPSYPPTSNPPPKLKNKKNLDDDFSRHKSPSSYSDFDNASSEVDEFILSFLSFFPIFLPYSRWWWWCWWWREEDIIYALSSSDESANFIIILVEYSMFFPPSRAIFEIYIWMCIKFFFFERNESILRNMIERERTGHKSDRFSKSIRIHLSFSHFLLRVSAQTRNTEAGKE